MGYDKLVDSTKLDGALTATADAIREKTGDATPIDWDAVEGFASAITAIPVGALSDVPMKDVNFYDCDGTRLYSYTLEEAQALTELPPLPTRDGLICQGWNYDLVAIKDYKNAVDVGAMYITDDGKTRLYIRLVGRLSVPLYFSQTVANGVTIDWGDGTAAQTLDGTGNKNTTHTYAENGDYVISLEVAEGCTLSLGKKSISDNVFGSTNSDTPIYSGILQRVEFGSGVTSIEVGTFRSLSSLCQVVIPNGVTSIRQTAFLNCYSLAFVVLPSSVNTFTQSSAFTKCHSLSRVVLPAGMTTLGEITFNECCSLFDVIVPNGVTETENSTFALCYSLARVVFPSSLAKVKYNTFLRNYALAVLDFRSATAVPVLESYDAFADAQSDLKILVPAALYDEWKSASNWSNFASKIVAV